MDEEPRYGGTVPSALHFARTGSSVLTKIETHNPPALVCRVVEEQGETPSAPKSEPVKVSWWQPLVCALVDGDKHTIRQSPGATRVHPYGGS